MNIFVTLYDKKNLNILILTKNYIFDLKYLILTITGSFTLIKMRNYSVFWLKTAKIL